MLLNRLLEPYQLSQNNANYKWKKDKIKLMSFNQIKNLNFKQNKNTLNKTKLILIFYQNFSWIRFIFSLQLI